MLPSIGSRRESTKGAMLLKIHKLFRRSPLNSSHRKRLKPDTAFKSFIISLQVVANETRQKGQSPLKFYERFLYYLLTYTKEFRGRLSNQNAYSLQIVYGYFIKWTVRLMSSSLNDFSFSPYVSKGIFNGHFASFGKDFNTWICNLSSYSRKNFII